ncbi:HutD family protein [Sphingopyxis sp. BSN-002]|uniref:HutD/Ves family protein n=1 Tax=Sphingopyxis sp. BSN-002 TaxID=2911495 RepID=UPI001EDBF73B|nr:HutD family protein [Sphingopyxis sp. BSN-002]UKK85822.1 HutD family protein [Sphingopyxis sp. BSN-002]
MAGVRFLPAKDRVARPCKNGGGVTRDITVFPEGTSDADFLWRVSLATIADAGPFSPFPGVDRAFLLLRGELAIAIGDQAEQHIRPGAPALLFGGDEPVAARPVAGSCTALNIMARRGQTSAKVGRWTGAQTTLASALLLFAPEATAIEVDGEQFDLAPDDALLLHHPAGLSSIKGAVIATEIFYDAA